MPISLYIPGVFSTRPAEADFCLIVRRHSLPGILIARDPQQF